MGAFAIKGVLARNEPHKERVMPTDPPETLYVDDHIVACDGGEGPLGHPRVFLNLGEEGKVECPYCDRLFVFGDPPGLEEAMA